jgi:hypothetical protein
MTKPGVSSQVCPRCKLVSPATATECDCGYDLRVSWDGQPGRLLENPHRLSRTTRGAGIFLICVAALGATVFSTRGSLTSLTAAVG